MADPLLLNVESFSTLRDELIPLEREHFAEVEEDQDVIAYGRDERTYAAMDAAGSLCLITARTGGGTLVGYLLAIVSNGVHSVDTLIGTLDSYYLRPEFRRGLNGVQLLRKAEQVLAARGCRKLYGGYKETYNLSRLFQHLGWTPSERYFSKVI